MRNVVTGLFLAMCVTAAATTAEALSNGGTADADNFDCAVCYYIGGWGPGPVLATCHQTKSGKGGECYIENNRCKYRSGCVSLPGDVSPTDILGLPL